MKEKPMLLGHLRLPLCFAIIAAAASAGCRPNHSASAATSVQQDDIDEFEAKREIEERPRKVGRGLAQLQLGMTRQDVEAILGRPDDERVPRKYYSQSKPRMYSVVYYAIFEPRPDHRWPVGGPHLMTVVYQVAENGADLYIRVDGPHRPVD
jgi:hypothetical protein